jgi:ABC-2 type transport system permease protein
VSAVVLDGWWMTHRRLKALMRQPWVIVMTLVQPAVWLFLFGNLFRKVTELPGFATGSYLDFLVPGVIVMSAVSSNMWAGMGVIEEIERGTLDRFLTTPVRRGAILQAGIAEQALSTAVQSVLIVALGRIAGAAYPGGLGGVAVLVAASVLLGTVFGALSSALGMMVRQRESIIGMSVFLLLPLTFLSSAFMPPQLMPGWMQRAADANPVNWALDAARAGLADRPDWPSLALHGGGLLALALASVWLSTFTFRSYRRSV